MGLKCSVLGHKYGDATVERDREEQGSEVVITIREIETCDRCGTDRIVSENKEVTSIATPDEPGDADGTAASDEGPESAATGGDSSGASTAATDPAEPSDPVDASADADSVPAVDDAPGVDGTEGAEILDAESETPVGDDELADPTIEDAGLGIDDAGAGSDHGGDDPDEEDAVIVDAGGDDGAEDDGGRGPGEWPEEPDAGDDESWEPSVPADDSSITAPDEGTDYNAAVTVPDGEFRCPECDFTTPVESSSLRAGDFCPDCHTGTLVHDGGDGTRKG